MPALKKRSIAGKSNSRKRRQAPQSSSEDSDSDYRDVPDTNANMDVNMDADVDADMDADVDRDMHSQPSRNGWFWREQTIHGQRYKYGLNMT